MILRPFGIVVNGELELGVELVVEDGMIVDVRPHTGVPEDYIVSPAFVNAHSHLEYRGMLNTIQEKEYWPWIRELTRLKSLESESQVAEACRIAAFENRSTGVGWIGEHSDRPFAAPALTASRIGGTIFQEIITFFERENRAEKIAKIGRNADLSRMAFAGLVVESPHAYQTVDRATLASIGANGQAFSIHVAESPYESQLTIDGSGPIGDFYRQYNIDLPISGKRIVPTLADLGLVRPKAQFVHCCEVNDEDIELLARNGVSVAHCPRSNTRLKCAAAPVRRMLQAGLDIGLGMDSPASGGSIDFFAEMRSASFVATAKGEPITHEQVWNMATTMGHRSFASLNSEPWEIAIGSRTPLIKVHCSPTETISGAIMYGGPQRVEHVIG